MAQNVSYRSDDTTLEALILHILPSFGLHGDGILNTNALTAILNLKGAKEVVDGGLEAWFGIDYKNSTNFKWQGKNDDMSADGQDPSQRLRFDWKVFTGSVVLNDLDKARNKGRAAIKDFAATLKRQAKTTIGNQYNSAFWALTPTGSQPESIPSLISATPTSGTIGGLTRSAGAYLQNKVYTTAISDIGSEAGIAKMIELRIEASVGQSMPDIIIMDQNNFGGLAGFLTTQRRYKNDESMAKLGFEAIDLMGCTVTYENLEVMNSENTIPTGYMYGINSKNLFVKTLRDGDGVWESNFERIGKTINRALFYKWFGNLVTNNPRAHFVATSVSTS